MKQIIVMALAAFGAAATLRAADGTWIAPGGGVWSDTANW